MVRNVIGDTALTSLWPYGGVRPGEIYSLLDPDVFFASK